MKTREQCRQLENCERLRLAAGLQAMEVRHVAMLRAATLITWERDNVADVSVLCRRCSTRSVPCVTVSSICRCW